MITGYSLIGIWLTGAVVLAPVIYLWMASAAWGAPRWLLLAAACWLALIWPIAAPLVLAWFAWERLRG